MGAHGLQPEAEFSNFLALQISRRPTATSFLCYLDHHSE